MSHGLLVLARLLCQEAKHQSRPARLFRHVKAAYHNSRMDDGTVHTYSCILTHISYITSPCQTRDSQADRLWIAFPHAVPVLWRA